MQPKKKRTAVLLAVFLGMFAWLYTYKLDSTKFWVNLLACLVTLGLWGFIAWIWAIVDAVRRKESWYQEYPHGDGEWTDSRQIKAYREEARLRREHQLLQDKTIAATLPPNSAPPQTSAAAPIIPSSSKAPPPGSPRGDI